MAAIWVIYCIGEKKIKKIHVSEISKQVKLDCYIANILHLRKSELINNTG